MTMMMMKMMMAWFQVMLWDEQLNQEMAKAMLAEGILVIPLRFLLIIMMISTMHTHQNMMSTKLCPLL